MPWMQLHATEKLCTLHSYFTLDVPNELLDLMLYNIHTLITTAYKLDKCNSIGNVKGRKRLRFVMGKYATEGPFDPATVA
jgi:hypothetical protein